MISIYVKHLQIELPTVFRSQGHLKDTNLVKRFEHILFIGVFRINDILIRYTKGIPTHKFDNVILVL